MTRTFTDPETIDVREGERFEVVLTGNAVGGYEWELVDAGGAVLVEARIEAGDGEAAGAAGRAVFVFELADGREETLVFAFRRAWEGEPQREHRVCVAVADQPGG